jgi:hypothetical protein
MASPILRKANMQLLMEQASSASLFPSMENANQQITICNPIRTQNPGKDVIPLGMPDGRRGDISGRKESHPWKEGDNKNKNYSCKLMTNTNQTP